MFVDNLRGMLMTAPLRVAPPPAAADLNARTVPRIPSPPEVVSCALGAPGDRLPVVGLDPGWVHGTKWAACDPLGDVLATGVIHVTLKRTQTRRSCASTTADGGNGVAGLVKAMRDHGCVAIFLVCTTGCFDF